MRLRYLPFLVLIILLISPASAVVNLRPQSQYFASPAAWGNSSMYTMINTTTAYDDTNLASTMFETTATASHYINLEINAAANTNYTTSFYVKRNSSSAARYVQLPMNSVSFGVLNYSNFDLETCTVTASPAMGWATAESSPLGWCRISSTTRSFAASSASFALAAIRSPLDTRTPSYAGTVGNSTFIFGSQVEIGDSPSLYNATNWQPTGNFTASTYTGSSPQTVTLTDTSTPSETISWDWYAINTSNSSPEYAIGTSKIQPYVFGEGNWTVKVKASNYLFSGNSSPKYINVSSEVNVYPLSDPTNKTQSQYLPDTSVASLTAGTQVNLTSAKGEYEPASFILNGAESLSGITITIGDLTSGANTLSASNIDARLVVPWYNPIDSAKTESYTANMSPYAAETRFLVNELLTYDNESFIKRDDAAKSNYIRVTFANTSTLYQNISTNATDFIPLDATFDDKTTLQPFNITASKNTQIWLTVNVSPTQATGNYSGTVSLKRSDGTYLKNITLNARIRNFTLSDNTLQVSLNFIGRIKTGTNGVSGANKTAATYAKELADMKAHGITYPQMYHTGYLTAADNTSLDTQLSLLNQSGMPKDAVYIIFHGAALPGDVTTEPGITNNITKLNYFKSRATYYGFGKTYFFASDEATEPALSRQRTMWINMHLNGSYVFVAGGSQLGNVADLLDTGIISSFNETMKDVYHSYGHKVWVYAQPQAGIPNPEIYRKNYGFNLYNSSYDGANSYGYQSEYGDIWNNFDSTSHYVEEDFSRPTTNGVVNTIEFEGFREAADDNRYVATLINTDLGNDAKAKSSVKSNISLGRLPSEIREQLAYQIEGDIITPIGSTITTPSGPQIFNWYCPAGRWCLGPFIIWDPAFLVTATA